MNAIPELSQAPINGNAAQSSGATPADFAAPSANGRDFAAALSNAGSKTTRKPATHKDHDGGATGGQLPTPGNLSPPPTSAPASPQTSPTTAAPVASADGGTVNGAAAAGGAPTAAAIPGAAVDTAGWNAGAALLDQPGAASVSTAASPVVGAQVLGLPITNALQARPPSAGGAVSSGATGGVSPEALANATQSTDEARSAAAAGVAAAKFTAAASGVVPLAAPAGPSAAVGTTPLTAAAAANAATSGPSGIGGGTIPATNAGDGTNSGGAAQAATAAAISAAATGGAMGKADFAGADPSSRPADDLATQAAGTAAQVAESPNGAPLPVPVRAVAALHPAATAATVRANAQAMTALANAGAADKHASGGTGDVLSSGTAGDAAAGAAQLSGNTTSITDAAPMPTLTVAAGVDSANFGQGVADRVSWMVDNNLSSAKLQLNPPQLGPIEVRIAVQGDRAQVWLTSHSAVTRDALQSSSPKLREMLGAQGFGQVSVDISQRSFQERPSQAQPYDWTASDRGAFTVAAPGAISIPRTSRGAVDAYA